MLDNFQYSQPPFSFLTTLQKQFLKTRLNTCCFKQGECIAHLDRTAPTVYLLVEGHVEKRALKEKKVQQKYAKNDVLVLSSCRSGNQKKYEFYVTEDLRCYQLRDEAFQHLCLENPTFAAWFAQDDLSGAISLNFAHSASFMLAPISEESFAKLCYLPGETTIADAAQYMHAHDLKTLMVQLDGGGEGLLTLSDLLWALTLRAQNLQTPIADIVKKELHSVDYNDLLFHAMLVMTKNKEQRVVVRENNQTRGLIELPLLMHKFFPNAPSFAFQIRKAHSLTELQDCAQSIDQFLRKLATHQVSLPYLMPVAQALCDAILNKAFTLSFPKELLPKLCLIVMGNEGRGERILACEPTHALILDDDLDHSQVIKHCRKFHQSLTRLNYYFGEKTISLMDPEWVKSVTKWQHNVNFWCQNLSSQARHHVGLIQDSRAIAGDVTYLELVREYLLDPHKSYPNLVEQQFHDICDLETPLTVLGGIKSGSDGLNLQETALNPILGGLRSLCLLHHLDGRSTFERLEQLLAIKIIDEDFAEEIKQAFSLFYAFDLQIRVQQEDLVKVASLNPDRITKHDRDKLRMAYHTVRQFKQWLKQQVASNSASAS